jgi:Ulp1 family protease
LDIARQANLFFNTFLIHKDKFSRLRQTEINLLRRVDYKVYPLQTNGHDCGVFAFAIALHLVEQIKLHRDFSHRLMSLKQDHKWRMFSLPDRVL